MAEARRGGVDIFRIFDALNDAGQMLPAIKAAQESGGLVEGTLCYSGDLADPAERLYTLDYYLRLAEELVAAGSHVLAVKDMAGLLRAPAARRLVTALRERFEAAAGRIQRNMSGLRESPLHGEVEPVLTRLFGLGIGDDDGFDPGPIPITVAVPPRRIIRNACSAVTLRPIASNE